MNASFYQNSSRQILQESAFGWIGG